MPITLPVFSCFQHKIKSFVKSQDHLHYGERFGKKNSMGLVGTGVTTYPSSIVLFITI